MSLLPLLEQDDDPFDFTGSVGRNGQNRREDVIKAQTLLADAGVYKLPKPGMPTGWPGDDLTQAITNWQRERGLAQDGVLLPMPGGKVGSNGDGETLGSLKHMFGGSLSGWRAPTPAEADRFYEAYARDPEAKPLSARNDNDGGLPDSRASRDGEYQVAAAPALALPWLIGAAGSALAGAGLLQQRQRPSNDFRPAPDMAPTQPSSSEQPGKQGGSATPPLQPPPDDLPPQGRPPAEAEAGSKGLIPPDMKDWHAGLPPRLQPVAEEIAGIIVESNPHGSRGSPLTEHSNKLLLRICTAEIENYPELIGKLKHHGGAYHEDGTRAKEMVIKRDKEARDLLGSVRPDVSWKEEGKGENLFQAHFQTVDTRKGAGGHDINDLTKRELRNYHRIRERIEKGIVGWARKMLPDETEAEYEAYLSVRCRETMSELAGKVREWEKEKTAD